MFIEVLVPKGRVLMTFGFPRGEEQRWSLLGQITL